MERALAAFYATFFVCFVVLGIEASGTLPLRYILSPIFLKV